jgi:hypothetical protein
MVVATRTVETATTSSAPVVERATRSGATAGTVSTGGAITGGRVCADGPPLGAEAGATTEAGGDDPVARGTTEMTGRDVGREGGEGVRFGGAVAAGIGLGVPLGGLLQQRPSP